MNANAARIEASGLRVQFATSANVLDGLDFEIPRGQFVSIVGPSGCGKTTLLKTVAGLQPITSGRLLFEPEATPGRLGFVFQKAALLPWRQAWQNVALPLELSQQPPPAKRRRELAEQWLERVGLHAADRTKPAGALSGGMQMRVSIARALVTEPAVLLLDEPFAALDDLLRTRLGILLQTLWRNQGMTVLLVTHNITEAVWLSQRVLVMEHGQLLDDIPVDLDYPRPESSTREPRLSHYVDTIMRRLQETAPA